MSQGMSPGATQEMKPNYNVVIMGKTGVGKSSLINYLFGYDKRKTGTGKPVTERGFEHDEVPVNGFPVRIFDSWGLEAGRAKEWLSDLKAELAQRGVNQPVNEWFHSIFYCIGAGSARIEDFELDIIRQFRNEKYAVTVLITKADQATPAELTALQAVLSTEFGSATSPAISVIPVCNEEKILLGGRKTERFGKLEVEAQIVADFSQAIAERLPDRCISYLNSRVDIWNAEQIALIEAKLRTWNKREIHEQLQLNATKFTEFMQNNFVGFVVSQVADVFATYQLFVTALSAGDDVQVNMRASFMFMNYRTIEDVMANLFTIFTFGIYNFFARNAYKEDLIRHLDDYVSWLKHELAQTKPQIDELVQSLLTSSLRSKQP